MTSSELADQIWAVSFYVTTAYKPNEYAQVILPFTVLRRLECLLHLTKEAVLAEHAKRMAAGLNPEPFLLRLTCLGFYNTSTLTLKKLLGAPENVDENLRAYVDGFSGPVRDVFEGFDFAHTVLKLREKELLYRVTEAFAAIDLDPALISHALMGEAFEELIRRAAEMTNDAAHDRFTPRDVVRLAIRCLFVGDEKLLQTPGRVRTILDPACGSGGMLSLSLEHLARVAPSVRFVPHGQELMRQAFAVGKANLLMKAQDVSHLVQKDTLVHDAFDGQNFDYLLCNPPHGEEWKNVRSEVEKERKKGGRQGRFGPGLPHVDDSSLLFVLHMVSKMRGVEDGGARLGVILNGSPLFTGAAGSGPSDIRKHLLESDLVEAIIALPTDLYFNTGIATYLWLLTNRKRAERRGKVQLIDASRFFHKMRRSSGKKRHEVTATDVDRVLELYRACAAVSEDGRPVSRVFSNEDFGYRTITVEQPLRDENGQVVLGKKGHGKGQPMPDPSLRDTENVPLSEDVDTWFEREVRPHAPLAWVDASKTETGYEIPFNRRFYVFKPPKSLQVIDAELRTVRRRIQSLFSELLPGEEQPSASESREDSEERIS